MGSLFTDERLNCGQNLEEAYTSLHEPGGVEKMSDLYIKSNMEIVTIRPAFY